MDSDIKNNTFAELERVEKKYIIKLEDMPDIIKEIESHLKPAYTDPKTKYIYINSIYLDSEDRKSFKNHISGYQKRQKIRLRSYSPNGIKDDTTFLEVKEKDGEETHKSRLQLDKDNLENVKSGKKIDLTDELIKINSPLFPYSSLNKFVKKFNNLVDSMGLRPVVEVNYRREAFGKGSFRITVDSNVTGHSVGSVSLSDAYKIKKSVDWSRVKDYKDSYSRSENAILEIKYDNKIPVWTQKLLDEYDLKEEKFSKYIYITHDSIKLM